MTIKDFGKTKNGKAVKLYTIENAEISVSVSDYGATITSIKAADKSGKRVDVTLGYDTITEYEDNGGYLGATIGRYANRIGKAEFTLNGIKYPLAKNDGENHLHGGNIGFDKKIWTVKAEENKLTMTTKSADMEEGYPGNLDIAVTFEIKGGVFTIEYRAKTDKDTIINLTNHSYFNLSGHDSGAVYDQTLQINAPRFTRVDGEAIPTGELVSVEGTPFDFTSPHKIGERIDDKNADLLSVGGGYDHNFAVDGRGKRLMVSARSDRTGICMEVSSDQPGVQLYTANMLDPVKGKNGAEYGKNHAFCVETQCYPDTPNKPDFPSCVLKADEEYHTVTEFKFSVKNG